CGTIRMPKNSDIIMSKASKIITALLPRKLKIGNGSIIFASLRAWYCFRVNYEVMMLQDFYRIDVLLITTAH
ncbi:MAG: hypothetical protein ACPH9T_04325, partial [Paracoccaceae bacterium]